MRQIEHKDFSVAGYLGMIEVALVRVVLLGLPCPLSVFVLLESDVFGALDNIGLSDIESLKIHLKILKLSFLLTLLKLH